MIRTDVGILLAMTGGVTMGNSMVPLNYLRRWRWENAWIAFSLVALVVLLWSLAFVRIPNLLGVYRHVDGVSYILPLLYGAGWGVAHVLLGLAVVRVGMALAFAVMLGLSAACGALVPILFKDPQFLTTEHGRVFMVGLLLMAGGVIACTSAGRQREKKRRDKIASPTSGTYSAGIVMAAVAGMLSPMLNYALAFGDSFIREALRQHAMPADAPYSVWPVALAGALIPNLAYTAFLANAHKSWKNFLPLWPDIMFGALMGILWMASIAVYGTATTFLGVLGASVGWSIFQISIILTANTSGSLSDEWKGVSMNTIILLWSGLLLLGSAMFAISYGSR